MTHLITKTATEGGKQRQSWIRPMMMKDAPQIVSMASDMHQESTYKNLDFDPVKLIDIVEMVCCEPEYFAFIYDDGEIKGLAVGYVMEHFFGHDLTSGDLAIYVKPEHRRGRVGVDLVVAYREQCLKLGVKEPLLGVSAGINPERIGKLYQRLGFTEKYTIYKMPEKM